MFQFEWSLTLSHTEQIRDTPPLPLRDEIVMINTYCNFHVNWIDDNFGDGDLCSRYPCGKTRHFLTKTVAAKSYLTCTSFANVYTVFLLSDTVVLLSGVLGIAKDLLLNPALPNSYL